MSAHLSRLRLFQRHLRRLVWAWVWVWDWIHSHTPPRTRSPSSRHPPFTHYPFPPRSLVCGGQPSPHKPRLVVSHSTCPPLSSSPHAHNFVLGTAVITHTHICGEQQWQPLGDSLWGRVVGREGAERSVGRCHGVWKGILCFYSCEPYSTSNKTKPNMIRSFVSIRYPKLGHGVCVLTRSLGLGLGLGLGLD
jgi:hypothetical protein